MAKKEDGKKAATPKALRVFNWLSMQAARFCDSSDSRFMLGCVCFRGRKTVATDGRQLVVIDAPEVQDHVVKKTASGLLLRHPNAHEVKETARNRGVQADADEGKTFLLAAAIVRRLVRGLAKRKKGIDHYALVDSRAVKPMVDGGQPHPDSRVTFVVGREDSTDITELRPVEGSFPAYEKAIPKDKPAVVIDLNPGYLERICKLMKDVCSYGSGYSVAQMKLSVYGPDKPVKIEAKNEETEQKALAVLMPLNPDVE